MYWVLGAAAIIGVVAWLNGEEQSACATYNAASHKLAKETAARQQQMAERRASYHKNQDFYEHINLHYASIQTASALYDQYNHHKNLVAMFYDKKQQFGRRIVVLKKQHDMAIGIQKEQVRAQLQQIQAYFEEAKQQLKILHELKTDLLYELRHMNNDTREYKIYIRDHCGQKGRDWYGRGLERKSLRSAV